MSDHDADEELARLTQPLPDAEETVRAIYHGAVDAVVVQGPRGPQIVTLKGSEEPYRILVDRMTEGALTVGQDGTILFANRRLAQMTGHSADDSAGRNLGDFLAEPFANLMLHWLEFPPDKAVRHEVMMCRADGSQFPALLWVGAIVLDQLPALLITATDLTAQKQSEQIAAAEQFVRSILEQASDAIIVCDRSGRITHASWAAQELIGRTPIGLRFVEALPLNGMETGAEKAVTPVLDAGAIVHHLLAGQSMRNIEVRAFGSRRADSFFLLNGGPLLDSHNLTVGCIVTLTDITERRRAEEKQTILVAELNHRVKNILAIVRAVAAQTLVRSLSLSAFKEAFDGRLKALSLAHDILTSIPLGAGRARHPGGPEPRALSGAGFGAAHRLRGPQGAAADAGGGAVVHGAARTRHQCRQIRRPVGGLRQPGSPMGRRGTRQWPLGRAALDRTRRPAGRDRHQGRVRHQADQAQCFLRSRRPGRPPVRRRRTQGHAGVPDSGRPRHLLHRSDRPPRSERRRRIGAGRRFGAGADRAPS